MSVELSYLLLAVIGVVAGIVNVLAGGGSLLTLPVMDLYMGLPGPLANGTNRVNLHKSFVVAVFTVVALAVYAANGQVAWLPGLWLACGNSAGAWIGTHYAVKKGDRLVRVVFDLAVIALVIKLLLSRG